MPTFVVLPLWLEGWGRRGWNTKKGQTIKNIDLWQQLDEELQNRWAAQEGVKVPSHVGLEGNEHADKLADEGVRRHGVRPAADGKEKRPAEKRPEQQIEPPERQAKRRRLDGESRQPNPIPQPQPQPQSQDPYPGLTPVQIHPYLNPDPPALGQRSLNQSSSSPQQRPRPVPATTTTA